jgi:hypothetical protein
MEFFIDINPSDRTMALGSTQPLTEMSTRSISWVVKAAGALGSQPYHLHVPTVLNSGIRRLNKVIFLQFWEFQFGHLSCCKVRVVSYR